MPTDGHEWVGGGETPPPIPPPSFPFWAALYCVNQTSEPQETEAPLYTPAEIQTGDNVFPVHVLSQFHSLRRVISEDCYSAKVSTILGISSRDKQADGNGKAWYIDGIGWIEVPWYGWPMNDETLLSDDMTAVSGREEMN